MRIHEIAATGLKGPGFRHQLAPMTLITGDNGAGKTAITDAIKIALLNRHPVLGAKNAAIFKLASGKLLEIEIGLTGQEGDTRWSMSWEQKGKTIKANHRINEDQDTIRTGIIPAVLDFNAFALAKPTERQRILEDLMGAMEDQAQPVKVQIAGMNQAAVLALEGLEKQWDRETFQDFERVCREAKRAVGQDVKRLAGAVQQSMVDEATELMASDTNAINPLDLLAAEKDLAKLNQQIGEQQHEVNRIATMQMNAPDRPAEPRPEAKDIEDLHHRIHGNATALQEAQKAIQHNSPIHVRVQQIDKAMEGAPTEGTKPESIRIEMGPARDSLAEAETRLNFATKEAERAEQAIRSAKADRDRLTKAGTCPTCGTSGDGLEQSIRDVFQPKIEALKSELDKAVDERLKAAEAINQATNHIEAVRDLNQQWDAWEAFQQARELKAERVELVEELEPVPETENQHELQVKLTETQRIDGQWKAYEQAVGLVPSKEEAERALHVLEDYKQAAKITGERIAELKDQQEKHQGALARVRNMTKHQEDLEIARAAENGLQVAAGWAKERSMKATADAMAPILVPANLLLAGVVEGALWIEGTEIGIAQDGKFHPLEVLSGAEATAVAAAIQVAIASRSSVRTVIVDEMSRMTQARKVRLCENLREAIERGQIEQAIVLDHDEFMRSDARVHGSAVIECGKGAR